MFILKAIVVIFVIVLILRLIFRLPDIENRETQQFIPISSQTTIGAAVEDTAAQHRGKSGVLPLFDGVQALQTRILLADMAESSIDAQYYIWKDDTSSMLLLDSLRKAAERGVRVRLLLDDNGVPGLDGILRAMEDVPNFEIRLWNPSTIRRPKLAGYAIDFFRMNRRMHNKSFIVDGAAAVIGGRNIGDEYFQVREEGVYFDQDVLGAGPVVNDVSTEFDNYWNSQSSYAVYDIVKESRADMETYNEWLAQAQSDAKTWPLDTDRETILAWLGDRQAELEWTTVELFADDPIKGLGKAEGDQYMINVLQPRIMEAKERLNLVSAYFIPGDRGEQAFAELRARGVDVRTLTNAWNTTDVSMVHAGYVKYREQMLKDGVIMYELKPRPEDVTPDEDFFSLRFSAASLHAKTFSMDDTHIFIGSFNFDPRSAALNCEMGFLIESETLANRYNKTMDVLVPRESYEAVLTEDGELNWIELLAAGETITYDEEPDTSVWSRAYMKIVGWLPVEWLL